MSFCHRGAPNYWETFHTASTCRSWVMILDRTRPVNGNVPVTSPTEPCFNIKDAVLPMQVKPLQKTTNFRRRLEFFSPFSPCASGSNWTWRNMNFKINVRVFKLIRGVNDGTPRRREGHVRWRLMLLSKLTNYTIKLKPTVLCVFDVRRMKLCVVLTEQMVQTCCDISVTSPGTEKTLNLPCF